MYLNRGSGILSESSIDTMFYGDTIYVDGDIPYCTGTGGRVSRLLFLSRFCGTTALSETGNACIFLLPESSLAMAVTANVNDYFAANAMIDSLGWGVALMLLGMRQMKYRAARMP